MTVTRIAITAGEPRAHVTMSVGALAPRLVSRDSRRAHVAVAAAGMVLLGGDHVQVEIDVGAGCTLEIQDVGGTVAYRGSPSSWVVKIRVGADATLLWDALPFVVTDGADVERRSSITLEAGGRTVIRETLVLGRHGERGGRLVSALSVSDGDGPILIERLEAEGTAPEPGVLGANRVHDAVCALGFRPSIHPNDLEFERAGALARHLSDHTHGSPLDPVWEAWVTDAARRDSQRLLSIPPAHPTLHITEGPR